MDLLSVLIGMIAGIISSLMSWWLLFHFFVSKIEFSNGISKLPVDSAKSGYMYRVKIANVGSRDIVDVEVVIRYRVKPLNIEFPNNWHWETMSISIDKIPLIQRGTNRIFRIYPEKTIGFLNSKYPEEVRNKVLDESLSLEDLFRIGEQSHIRVYIFGYDSFSGSRKLFYSRFYELKDIKIGRFNELKIL